MVCRQLCCYLEDHRLRLIERLLRPSRPGKGEQKPHPMVYLRWAWVGDHSSNEIKLDARSGKLKLKLTFDISNFLFATQGLVRPFGADDIPCHESQLVGPLYRCPRGLI